MNSSTDPDVRMLRHTVATLAYRGRKTVLGAPEGFEDFHAGEGTRTPDTILAHIGDLLDWALWLVQGQHKWQSSKPLPWDQEAARFFTGLERLDAALAADTPLEFNPERLFQGPIADALTHVGQLALLRRLAGAPVRGENYFKAEIVAGRVGAEQAKLHVERMSLAENSLNEWFRAGEEGWGETPQGAAAHSPGFQPGVRRPRPILCPFRGNGTGRGGMPAVPWCGGAGAPPAHAYAPEGAGKRNRASQPRVETHPLIHILFASGW